MIYILKIDIPEILFFGLRHMADIRPLPQFRASRRKIVSNEKVFEINRTETSLKIS